MEVINLRYQVVFFGNYDDVTPSMENIKYFLDVFGDKNLIPSQFKHLNVNLTANSANNTETSRLSLTSPDGMWNIRFITDRVEFILTNSNVGKINMPDINDFLKEVEDILSKISRKFPKTHKRVGLVNHLFFRDINATKSSQKANKAISYFNDKPILEWNNKTTSRMPIQIPESEVINITSELRWVKTNVKILDKNTLLEGLLLNLDVNTLNENQNYRFKNENLKSLLMQMSGITEILRTQNIENLEN